MKHQCHNITCRQNEGDWDEVKMQVAIWHITTLCQRVLFALQFFAVTFDVLHKQVLAWQLIVVWEVVDGPTCNGMILESTNV